MRINPLIYGVLVLTVFFGIILGFQAAGIWSISGKVDASGEEINPSVSDVNTIKGWMTLDQITAAYNVSLASILQEFNLSADTQGSAAIKDLESDLFSVTTLRIWLQSLASPLSATVEGTPSVQAEPTAVVVSTPALTQSLPTAATSAPTSTPPVTATVHAAPDKTMTGKTTFQNLLDWGVTPEAIENVIGTKIPDTSMIIKDFLTTNGMDFSTIKSLLQNEINKIK